MRSPEAMIGVDQTQYINNFRISVSMAKLETPQVPLGDTAIHEAKHAVAAIHNGTDVRSVTISPGPGYLGLTELSRPDAVAAAAPHATGCSGTGHDVHIVGAMGHDIDSVSSIARSIIANNYDQVEAVALHLEEKRTISGYDVLGAMHGVTKEKKTSEKATVFMKAPDGSERLAKVDVQNDKVMVPGEWMRLGAG